jgi:hypothetical protein
MFSSCSHGVEALLPSNGPLQRSGLDKVLARVLSGRWSVAEQGRYAPLGDAMRSIKAAVGLLFLCVVTNPALAQLEEIMVTGSRISGDDYSRMPAIVLQRRADFLVQGIRLTNDTRAAEARSKELHQTIRDMLTDAASRPGIALSYGEDFLIPITPSAFEVPLSPGGNRPDTSVANIFVKMALGEKESVPAAIASLQSFIKKARVSGRTEVLQQGDVGLSLVTPERYRYDIISRITEDAKKLQAAVGSQCKVNIKGLSGRVSWQRSDISELTLYIPYTVELTECQ